MKIVLTTTLAFLTSVSVAHAGCSMDTYDFYKKARGAKALAITSGEAGTNPICYIFYGAPDKKTAEREALARCKKASSWGCSVAQSSGR